MSDLRYYKFGKPRDASDSWECNLFLLCRKHRITVMMDKIDKDGWIYSLSCPQESFEKLVKEMRRLESKTDEP